MKIRDIINEAQLKVSAKYWNSLRKIEQDYILDRHRKDGLAMLKMVISDARKQLPNFDKISGYGIVEKDGQTYKWSGDMTRKFHKV